MSTRCACSVALPPSLAVVVNAKSRLARERPSSSRNASGPDVDLPHEQAAGAAGGLLLESVGGQPHGQAGQVEGGGEGLAHRRVRVSRGLAVLRGVVAAARANLPALAVRGAGSERHLDLAVLPVARRVRRRVAEEVVAPGLVRDAAQPLGEVVRVLDHRAARVVGDDLGSRRGLPAVPQGQGDVPGGDRLPELGRHLERQLRKTRSIQEGDGSVGPAARRGHPPELRDLDVVVEAGGDEDRGLAPAHAGEGREASLEKAESVPQPGDGLQVGHAGRLADDPGVHVDDAARELPGVALRPVQEARDLLQGHDVPPASILL